MIEACPSMYGSNDFSFTRTKREERRDDEKTGGYEIIKNALWMA